MIDSFQAATQALDLGRNLFVTMFLLSLPALALGLIIRLPRRSWNER